SGNAGGRRRDVFRRGRRGSGLPRVGRIRGGRGAGRWHRHASRGDLARQPLEGQGPGLTAGGILGRDATAGHLSCDTCQRGGNRAIGETTEGRRLMGHEIKVSIQVQPQHGTCEANRKAWIEADELGADTVFTWDHFYPLRGEPDGAHFEAYTLLGS